MAYPKGFRTAPSHSEGRKRRQSRFLFLLTWRFHEGSRPHGHFKKAYPAMRSTPFWPTRKDSEPRPRIARAGSAAKADFPFCSLGASTQLLALTSRPTEKTPTRGVFSIGLPERIRTFDLQSRSLTRYPAVPRVGMKLYPIIIAYLREKCKPFLKKSRAARSLFARLFPTKDPPRRGLDPCGKLSLYLWISPQVFRKVSHTLWKTLWTSRPKS